MERKLEVFLSSSIVEFTLERKYLTKKISKIQFLNCELLENRGAKPNNTLEASLEAVRKSHIVIGIIGEKDSEITRKEIEEAIKLHKPCLIYVKDIDKRNVVMNTFLNDIIKPNLTYYKYKNKQQLYRTIVNDLEKHIMDLLEKGLDYFKREKQEAIRIEKQEKEQINKIIKKRGINILEDLLDDAETAYHQQDYMSTIVKTSIAMEVSMRNILKTKGFPEKELRKPIISLIEHLRCFELLESRDVNDLTEIRIMRNDAIHLGKMPSQDSAKFALMITRRITDKLSHIVSIPMKTGSDQSCVKTGECFKPEKLTIGVNESVIWTNDDVVSHTITNGLPSDPQTGIVFDSNVITPAKTFTHTFGQKGVFHYYCQIHPWQTGSIVVQ